MSQRATRVDAHREHRAGVEAWARRVVSGDVVPAVHVVAWLFLLDFDDLHLGVAPIAAGVGVRFDSSADYRCALRPGASDMEIADFDAVVDEIRDWLRSGCAASAARAFLSMHDSAFAWDLRTGVEALRGELFERGNE